MRLYITPESDAQVRSNPNFYSLMYLTLAWPRLLALLDACSLQRRSENVYANGNTYAPKFIPVFPTVESVTSKENVPKA